MSCLVKFANFLFVDDYAIIIHLKPILLNSSCRCIDDFEIIHGDLHGLSDTVSFLKSLVELNDAYDPMRSPEKRQMREQKAAAGVFNWEVTQKLTLFPFFLDCLLAQLFPRTSFGGVAC